MVGRQGDHDQQTIRPQALKEKEREDENGVNNIPFLPLIWKSFGSTNAPLCRSALRPGGRTWKSVIPNVNKQHFSNQFQT